MRLFLRGEIYYLEFSKKETPSGQRKTFSLKTSDLKKANKIKYYFLNKLLKEGRLSIDISLERFRDKMYEWLYANKTTDLTKSYIYALDLFIQLYDKDIYLKNLKASHINTFISYLLNKYAPDTVNNILGYIRAIFNHAITIKLCEANPFARFPRVDANTYEISVQDWLKIKARHHFTCLRCGKKEPEIKLTRDHIFPKSKGGKLSLKNTQPLCRSCNSSKGPRFSDHRPHPNVRTKRGHFKISEDDLARINNMFHF